MSIHEIEPWFKLGPIQLGNRLGPDIPMSTDIPVTLYHGGLRDVLGNNPHTVFVRRMGSDQVQINAVHASCDNCQNQKILEGIEINLYPQLGKKIRWVEN